MGGPSAASFWREVIKTFGQRPEPWGPSWAAHEQERDLTVLQLPAIRQHTWLKSICQALCPGWGRDVSRDDLILRRTSFPQNFSPVGAREQKNFRIRNSECEREAQLDFVIFPPSVLGRNRESGPSPGAPSALFGQLLDIFKFFSSHEWKEVVWPSARIKICYTVLKMV